VKIFGLGVRGESFLVLLVPSLSFLFPRYLPSYHGVVYPTLALSVSPTRYLRDDRDGISQKRLKGRWNNYGELEQTNSQSARSNSSNSLSRSPKTIKGRRGNEIEIRQKTTDGTM
jgi:hypothetical protein